MCNKNDKITTKLVCMDNNKITKEETCQMNGFGILIVDSNVELRSLMSRFLAQHFEISVIAEASNGMDALSVLAHKKVDVILLEIVLPVMDGFTFIEKLKELRLDIMPQIIVTSSLGREDFKLKAYSLGVKDYLVKPFEPAELITRILNDYSTYADQAMEIVC